MSPARRPTRRDEPIVVILLGLRRWLADDDVRFWLLFLLLVIVHIGGM